MTLIMRLFPAAWRRRYGNEFLALLDDQPAGRRHWFDIARCLVAAHLDNRSAPLHPSPAGRTSVCAVFVLVVLVAAFGAVFAATASQSAIRMAGDLVVPVLLLVPIALVTAFGWTAAREGNRPLRTLVPTVAGKALVLAVIGATLVVTLKPQLGFFAQAPWIEVRPFVDIATAPTSIRAAEAVADLSANALMFLLLGFALGLRRRSPNALAVVGPAMIFAIAIEVAQAMLGTGRPADSTDVIVRSGAVALGYGLWRLSLPGRSTPPNAVAGPAE